MYGRHGDRVTLVRTTDPYTELRPGATGTIRRWDAQHRQLHIDWDCGSTLAMLPDEGDEVCVIASQQSPTSTP